MVVVEVNGGLILVIGRLYDVAQAENIFQSPSARGVVVAPSGRGREAMAHEPIAFGRHVGHACHPHIVISGRVIYVPRAGGAGKREGVIGGGVAGRVGEGRGGEGGRIRGSPASFNKKMTSNI